MELPKEVEQWAWDTALRWAWKGDMMTEVVARAVQQAVGDALEAQEAMIKELEMALVGWVNAAEMLADEPGMDAHFQDIADATLDTVEGARNALSKAPSIK